MSLYFIFALPAIDRKMETIIKTNHTNTNIEQKLLYCKAPLHALVGSRGSKPKLTNSSTKHIKTKLYINKAIRSYIYVKKSNALTKSQYTLDIYISETNPKNNECLHTHHKTINLTFENHSKEKMTRQGKGAARDLLEDPDFVMIETISPPQGQK